MGTATGQWKVEHTSDAEYRTFNQNLYDMIINAGATAHSVSPEFNFATEVRPAAGAYTSAPRILKFNDALQATAPVFIKLEFGCGASSQNYPQCRITIGTTCTAGGVLGGQLSNSTIFTMSSNVSDTSATTHHYASCASNRVSFVIGTDAAGSVACAVNIERTKDATGADTGDAVYIFVKRSSFDGSQTIPFTGSIPGYCDIATIMVTRVAGGGTSSTYGTSVFVTPFFPILGAARNPLLNCLAYLSADITTLTQVSCSLYGTAHNYIAIGHASMGTIGNLTNTRLLMRYE